MELNILIASDDSHFVNNLKGYLFSLTENIITTNESEILLNMLFDLSSSFDFIILDNNLIGMEGKSIIPIIRRLNTRIPIIFIGAMESIDENIKLAATGVTARFVKPSGSSEDSSIYTNIKSIILFFMSNRSRFSKYSEIYL